jgi:hypothetical protein
MSAGTTPYFYLKVMGGELALMTYGEARIRI